MSKAYQTLFVVVLLNLHILTVFGVDGNEESQSNYEYIQIFKSIPALFEYLLDALEERPEILEKNDVTLFTKRNIEETHECKSENERHTDKRDTDCYSCKIKEQNSRNIESKREATTRDVSETTKAYEYGNSNIIMKGSDELDNTKSFSKRADNGNQVLIDKNEANSEVFKEQMEIYNRRKMGGLSKLDGNDIDLIFRNYGEAFFGFEHLFGLDLKPEDIEERILTAEKLLEDHNEKKEKNNK